MYIILMFIILYYTIKPNLFWLYTSFLVCGLSSDVLYCGLYQRSFEIENNQVLESFLFRCMLFLSCLSNISYVCNMDIYFFLHFNQSLILIISYEDT